VSSATPPSVLSVADRLRAIADEVTGLEQRARQLSAPTANPYGHAIEANVIRHELRSLQERIHGVVEDLEAVRDAFRGDTPEVEFAKKLTFTMPGPGRE
jgi:hypothetical protein